MNRNITCSVLFGKDLPSESSTGQPSGNVRSMLRVETSFQDTPGDGHYFVLNYDGRPLAEQLAELGLKDGDPVILWEADCGDFTVLATLLFDYLHPSMFERRLWAREAKPKP